jgi:hypothetical protein
VKQTIPKVVLWMLILVLCIAGGVSSVLAETEGQGIEKPTLSIEGNSSVPAGMQSQYTATLNGAAVNPRWGLKSTTHAKINKTTGVLTAKAVKKNRTAVVKASYTVDGTTYKASKTVTLAVLSANESEGSSLTIQGSTSVPGGTKSQYTASYNGNRVTASWSLSSTQYASISSSGVLSARSVSSNHTVTVNASYRRNGHTYRASESVTITASSQTVSLTGITVSGPSSVNSGGTASYTATASFSNGSTQNVSSGASWSANGVGSISGGSYSPGTVSANQTVTITASYSSGGVTRSGSTTVTVVGTGGGGATTTLSSVAVSGPSTVTSGGSASYAATATFSNGTTQNVTSGASWSVSPAVGSIAGGAYSPGKVTSNQTVTISASYTSGGVSRNGTIVVTVNASGATGGKSITSTSQNSATLPTGPVAEQPLTNLSGYSIFGVNDLGMHCGDLDHRVISILPPYNILHAQVVQKGTSTANPKILTDTDVQVLYSAVSNPNDPVLQTPTEAPIYKTNFWDPSPLQPTVSLAFDAFDPFYPPNILSAFPLLKDIGLPAPDLNKLYPATGSGTLTATQQSMPGVSNPYAANVPQPFSQFDKDYPFFGNFSYGYRQTGVNWFAADGIPSTPVDDFGRSQAFPLMRVQAKTKSTSLTGTSGAVIATVDAVTPVSGETSCYKCHTSKADGGGGYAAAIPGIDASATVQGSPRSGTAFTVARAADDTSSNPTAVKREWAADNNILRLHDAKYGTKLQNATPVSCQVCHYTTALDLAQLGPLGPGDANANGKDQKAHHSNSRVMHSFHAQFTDLFPNTMVPPNNAQRLDASGNPTINTYVQNQLNQTCYQCHPGASTKCLRGAMFGGGLVCNDCHGGMSQVGNDFSANFSAATPGQEDLTRRVPWVNEPKCQSCHTGDAMSNMTATSGVVKASDGIRLLQAYKTTDANATPIVATNKRFAEETAGNGNPILYRLSKGHSGIACESCHGSTHAEWPVQPETGTYIANDNMAANQLQGHTGKITECSACHTTSPGVTLGGPHGMHPVGDSRFISGHDSLVSGNKAQCQACHGQNGQGTVLSTVSVNRTVGSRTFTKGEQITCSRCHSNQLP